MLIITIHVDAPAGQAIGVKEQIAQDLERFGDTKIISIKKSLPQQLGMFAAHITTMNERGIKDDNQRICCKA